MYFFNIGTIGTFLFLSLGITFILCCLLVYHFKRRLDLFEQKNDTIFEIVNNVLTEISNIKQKQNVLFMLVKNPPIENIQFINKTDPDTNPDEDQDTNPDEDQDTNPDEDQDTNPEEDQDTNPEEDQDTNPDQNKKIVQLNNNDFSVFTTNEEIHKIKVIDDTDDDIIDFTTSDNDEFRNMINDSFTHQDNDEIQNPDALISEFISQLINGGGNGCGNGNNTRIFQNDIDFQMLNLGILRQSLENQETNQGYDLFHSHNREFEESNGSLNIHILDDNVNNIINVDEIESLPTSNHEIEPIVLNNNIDDYADMPDLEPIVLNNNNIDEYADMPDLEPITSDKIKMDESLNEVVDESLNEMSITTQPELVDDSLSVISEDITVWKKGEKTNYKKMSVQSLREIVVSKGIMEDASKLKKTELLSLLSSS